MQVLQRVPHSEVVPLPNVRVHGDISQLATKFKRSRASGAACWSWIMIMIIINYLALNRSYCPSSYRETNKESRQRLGADGISANLEAEAYFPRGGVQNEAQRLQAAEAARLEDLRG